MKKITFTEKEMIASQAMFKLIAEKKITDREALIYLHMRAYAFPKKSGGRHRCKKSAKYFADKLQVNRNKVTPKLKRLENLGIIKPIYRVKMKDKTIKEISSYQEAKSYGIVNLKPTIYIVNDLPNEDELIEKFIKKKSK